MGAYEDYLAVTAVGLEPRFYGIRVEAEDIRLSSLIHIDLENTTPEFAARLANAKALLAWDVKQAGQDLHKTILIPMGKTPGLRRLAVLKGSIRRSKALNTCLPGVEDLVRMGSFLQARHWILLPARRSSAVLEGSLALPMITLTSKPLLSRERHTKWTDLMRPSHNHLSLAPQLSRRLR
jgi:hypothetical protein